MGNSAIVVLSGGQDSTTCLYDALGGERSVGVVYPITFNYNQRHQREIEAAQKVVELAKRDYGAHRIGTHEIIEMGPILKGTSPLVSSNVLEQYKDHQSLPGGLEKTFVPMRNQLFLTIAMNRAIVYQCDQVITGVCEEDYGGYPDCRRVFIDSLEDTCGLGAFGSNQDGSIPKIDIRTPLMKLTKRETVERAIGIPGCYGALAYTHTAYDGAYPPLGHDHATLLRAKGFEEANVPDPLVLRAWIEGLMDLPKTPNYSVMNSVFGFCDKAELR